MIAFTRASVKALETFSGAEAVEQFLHSKRTYGDVKQRELLGNDFSYVFPSRVSPPFPMT